MTSLGLGKVNPDGQVKVGKSWKNHVSWNALLRNFHVLMAKLAVLSCQKPTWALSP